MKRFLTLSAVLGLTYVLFVSNENGPPAKYTNAPGDNGSCANNSCHSLSQGCNLTLNSSKVTINFGGSNATSYQSDSTYIITVQTGSVKINAALYGFQATAKQLGNGGKDSIGTFIPGVDQMLRNGGYINHSTPRNGGAANGHIFTFSWKAPSKAAYKDTVRFYVATNEAYHLANIDPKDDSIRTKSLTITWDSTIVKPSSLQTANKEKFSLVPNYISSSINIPSGMINKTYSIISVNGQLFKQGKAEERIDVSTLNSGLYYLQIENNISSFYKN